MIKYFWDQVWIYIHEKFTVYLLLLIYPLIFISVLKVRKKYSKKKKKKRLESIFDSNLRVIKSEKEFFSFQVNDTDFNRNFLLFFYIYIYLIDWSMNFSNFSKNSKFLQFQWYRTFFLPFFFFFFFSPSKKFCRVIGVAITIRDSHFSSRSIVIFSFHDRSIELIRRTRSSILLSKYI